MDWRKIGFNLYFFSISIIGVSIFIFSICNLNINMYLYLLWIVLFVAIEMRPISLDVKGQVSLGFALNLAILMIYGTWSSIFVTGVGSAIADIIGKRGWQKAVFNSAQYSISLLIAGMVYMKLCPSSMETFTIGHHIIPFIFTALTFVIINFLLVVIIVSLSFRISLKDVVMMDLGMMTLFLTSLAPMSLLMTILYTNEPWSIILILPPLALAHNGFENYLKLRKQTRSTIELLAEVVDRRDPYTASHSARVAAYAEQIAKEMGLSYELVNDVIMAGRVHDLGKVAISDEILLKSEPLTDVEYKEMKKHPEIGYNILSPLDMYKKMLSFVLYHHERVDGRGYPRGLQGTNIPLGARILAVADSFDAMTTNRPYRKAMCEEAAIEELIKNRTMQFDPQVVDAFVRVWTREKKARGET